VRPSQAQPALASPCASALSADRFTPDADPTDALLLRIDPTSSRAAVTGATSSRRQDPAGLADPAGVDGDRGSKSHVVCRLSAARLANTHASFAVSAPSLAPAPGTTTHAPSLALIRGALA
jgi:hypothetical protein